MDDNAETIAEIVAELAQYEESGERPCKEEVWRLGARIAEAARVAVLTERERCAAALEDAHIGHAEAIDLAAAIIRARK